MKLYRSLQAVAVLNLSVSAVLDRWLKLGDTKVAQTAVLLSVSAVLDRWLKLEQQSEATQRRMMGAHKHQEWKAGKFEFDALTTTRDDPIYGLMRSEASLKAILGE